MFALVDWLADPANTRIVVCSTTSAMLEDRIWGSILHFYHIHAQSLPASLIQSKKKILYSDRKTKQARAGIYGIAVQQGTEDEAVSNIIGVHLPRVRLIVDEMQATRRAAVKARSNLAKGAFLGFKFIGMGNPMSRQDPLCEYSIPIEGWRSIDINTGQWETTYGMTYHLDGFKSPAIADPVRFSFLINQEQIDLDIRENGENSPEVQTMCRGFLLNDDASDVVVGEASLMRHGAEADVVWKQEFIRVAGFDPAFSSDGDRAILAFLDIGIDNMGKLIASIHEVIKLRIDVMDQRVLLEQMCGRVIELCNAYGVPIEFLAVDDSGVQSAADEITRAKGVEPFRVSFGSVASLQPVSEFDSTLCRDKYADRVTEMWYSFARFVRYEQIRNLTDKRAIGQFSVRIRDVNAGRKTKILSKKKMKAFKGESPDEADAIVLALDVARQLMGIRAGSSTFAPGGPVRPTPPPDYTKRWRERNLPHEAMRQQQLVENNTNDRESEYSPIEILGGSDGVEMLL